MSSTTSHKAYSLIVLSHRFVIAEIIDTATALSGFSNEGMVTVGALFVVVKGVENRFVMFNDHYFAMLIYG